MASKKAAPKYLTYAQLTPIQRRLLDDAEKNLRLAYSPYSNFSVGTSLLTKDGERIPGTNIENANYTNTQHGETTAIAGAYTRGKRAIAKLAVITRGASDTLVPATSCGSCAQTLIEAAQVSGNDIELIYSNTKKDKIIVITTRDLMKYTFGPKDLGIDVSRYRTLQRTE